MAALTLRVWVIAVLTSHGQLGNFETLCARLAGTSGLAFFGTWSKLAGDDWHGRAPDSSHEPDGSQACLAVVATVVCIIVAAYAFFRGDSYGGQSAFPSDADRIKPQMCCHIVSPFVTGRSTAVGLRAASSKSAANFSPALFAQLKQRQQSKMRDFYDWELGSKQVRPAHDGTVAD